ncbi:Copia protein, partial [Glycine soja]
MKLRVDNRSAIDLAKHPIAHGRSKHIEVKYHFLRDQVNKGNLALEYCRSEDQFADILTKAVK